MKLRFTRIALPAVRWLTDRLKRLEERLEERLLIVASPASIQASRKLYMEMEAWGLLEDREGPVLRRGTAARGAR